jgi:hypothetical protein
VNAEQFKPCKEIVPTSQPGETRGPTDAHPRSSGGLDPAAHLFAALGGGAAAWPLVARGQQGAMPVVGFIDITSQPSRQTMYAGTSWIDLQPRAFGVVLRT